MAGYVDFRQDLARWLTIDAGVRVDHHSHTGTEWVPQAGVSVRLPREANLKLMASKGFRNPTLRELFMFRPANPDLRPERLWSYELSFAQHVFNGRLNYGVNLFYINGDNLIMRVQYVKGLYTSVRVAGTGEERTEHFVLWNAYVAFDATQWLNLWVKAENLLAQRYEVLAGFPMPKATFMGGVSLNF